MSLICYSSLFSISGTCQIPGLPPIVLGNLALCTHELICCILPTCERFSNLPSEGNAVRKRCSAGEQIPNEICHTVLAPCFFWNLVLQTYLLLQSGTPKPNRLHTLPCGLCWTHFRFQPSLSQAIHSEDLQASQWTYLQYFVSPDGRSYQSCSST